MVIKFGTLDQLEGLIVRLQESQVDWVRLEFIAPPTSFSRDSTGELDFKVDLKHFDMLVDTLCANGIAVLGLVDYQMLTDRSWEDNGGIATAARSRIWWPFS